MDLTSQTDSSVPYYRWLIVAARITNQMAWRSLQGQQFLKADPPALRKIGADGSLAEAFLKYLGLLLILRC
jgi:hypothetical protein